LEQTVQEAGVSNSRTLVMSLDVSDPEAVSALFAATQDTFGRLDVLFNNVGVGAPTVPLEDLRYEQLVLSELKYPYWQNFQMITRCTT
jgi:NAD(P)-dependent dehydrogenase (short-subunit alcohol dehydrogenase family)